MATISYKVTPDGDQWAVTRNGAYSMSYATQEAAYEVAVGEAGGDLRSGHDVVIEVIHATDPVGAHDRGGLPAPGEVQ